MVKKEIKYKIDYIPASVDEVDQDIRSKFGLMNNDQTVIYRLTSDKEKILLTQDYIEKRKKKNLADKSMEILVQIERIPINVSLLFEL